MTEYQNKTVKIVGRSTALWLCLSCAKMFEAGQLGDLAGGDQTCPADGTALMQLPEVGSPLVGNYLYQGLLGVGGMGVVFKALNPYLERVVAIKKVKGKKYDEKQLHRFQQEGKLLSKLEHPNLVSVLDFGANEQGEPYMVMEYLDGRSLASLIRTSSIIALPQALEILGQTCQGLAHAHKFGAVHRDIKPTNIFVIDSASHQPVVKLLDFGIAKLWFPEDPVAACDLTRTGEIFGSPLYMSPEQALGKSVDERSDLYSLGCVMYEMLSGHPPLVGQTAMETIFKHVSDQPLPLSTSVPQRKYPPAVQEVLTCLLAKDPAYRIESADRLGEILTSIVNANTADLQQLRLKARSVNLLTARENGRGPQLRGERSKSFSPLSIFASVMAVTLIGGAIAYFAKTKPTNHESFAYPKAQASSHSPQAPVEDDSIGIAVDDVLESGGIQRQFLDRELAKRSDTLEITVRELSAADFHLLADHGQRLALLDFSKDSGLNAQGISLLQKLPLCKLKIQDCDLDDAGLVAVTKISSLRQLTIKNCPDLSPEALIVLKKMPDLNLLHIEGVWVDPLVIKQILPKPYLNTLIINGSGQALAKEKTKVLKCNDALPEIGHCPALTNLDLSATDVTGEALKALTSLKRPIKLSLNSCARVDDSAIDSLTKLNLAELQLRDTPITQNGLERLLRNSGVRIVIISNRLGKLSPYLLGLVAAHRLAF